MHQNAGVPTPLRIEFDPRSDAAYVHFTDTEVGHVGPGKTFLCEPPHAKGSFYLEFDANWRLTGIEIMGAKRVLRQDLLERLRRGGAG